MKFRLGACAAVVLLAACSGQKSDSDLALQGKAATSKERAAASAVTVRDTHKSIASAPDRGALVTYKNSGKPASREGAFTYYPVTMSEDHAIQGVVNGKMKVTTPDGRQLELKYDRHSESLNGNWSWVGHLEGGDPGQSAIITFGENAVFASIPQGRGVAPLEIQTRNGGLYAVQIDSSRLRSPNRGHNDVAIPASSTDGASAIVEAAQAQLAAVAQKAVAENVTATAANTVDVVVGYTAGFRTYQQNNSSTAATRLVYLFEVANQALSQSNVNGSLRLVNALEVGYTDSNSNQTALQELTGSNGSPGSTITVPTTLTPLRTARDTYGADLAILVRGFQQPEQQGCGIAWLIGAAGADVVPDDDAKWGYGVVSDGSDNDTDGNSYYCAPQSMIHEIGHLLGQAHDEQNATSAGRHPYSYGYKNDAANFYTIMAYGNVGQTGYSYFSSPNLTLCGGNACGTANADNVRSLNQTIPVVAQFRATVVPLTKALDLYGINKVGGGNKTEVFALSSASNFSTFTLGVGTGLYATGSDRSWAFKFGNYNSDNVPDLYAFLKTANNTEVYVLGGADNFKTFLFGGASVLGRTGNDNRWMFKLGDYNKDGRLDVYAINRIGANGRTEIRVLNGADNFKTVLGTITTGLYATGTDNSWEFELGDYNGDGTLDLYGIVKTGASGKTEVHILDGANQFQTFLLNTATVLYQTGNINIWNFKLGDYDLDGITDIYAINKTGANNKTDLFVLNGANKFQSFLIGRPTGIYATGSDVSWEFELLPTP